MGIGTGQALLLRTLVEQGVWKDIQRVCDLGSQEPLAGELTGLFEAFGVLPLDGAYGADALYRHLGALHYRSIDFNGEHGALRFDLNKNLRAHYHYDEVFELVTNFGTTEHCFNQFEVFRNIHQLCATGGYMLHTVPTQGWGRHSLFRYDANFFEDLAAANDYQVVFLEPFLRLRPYLRLNKEDTIQHVRALCVFAESEFDKAASGTNANKSSGGQQGKVNVQRALACVGKESALFNVTLACVLKKNGADGFATPIQGMYRQHGGG